MGIDSELKEEFRPLNGIIFSCHLSKRREEVDQMEFGMQMLPTVCQMAHPDATLLRKIVDYVDLMVAEVEAYNMHLLK